MCFVHNIRKGGRRLDRVVFGLFWRDLGEKMSVLY